VYRTQRDGADVSVRNGDQWSPVMIRATVGDTDVVLTGQGFDRDEMLDLAARLTPASTEPPHRPGETRCQTPNFTPPGGLNEVSDTRFHPARWVDKGV